MRFLLDENVPFSLFLLLRQKGHDVVRAQEIGRGLKDLELLHVAKRSSRIFVTLDKDFARLYLLEPEVTIVLVNIHPALPHRIVNAFKLLLQKESLLKRPGLLVLGERYVKKLSLPHSPET